MSAFATSILPVLQALVSFCTLCTLLYAFKMFLQKPQKTTTEELKDMEKRLRAVEAWRSGCLNRFESQENSHRVTQKAMLALIDKEIEDQVAVGKDPAKELIEARQDLYDHLFSK